MSGQEIGIRQIGVPYGLLRCRTEPGYVLEDGTVLLESERDEAGRYQGGAGMDGMYLPTGHLYIPIPGDDGQIRAFQEVQSENYLANAEVGAEQNYNQIDGIINNEAPPQETAPSIRDRLRQFQEESAPEPPMEDRPRRDHER